MEFDFNLNFIYLPDEDFKWIEEAMNKMFPSTMPICDNHACWFDGPCNNVSFTGVDFTLEL